MRKDTQSFVERHLRPLVMSFFVGVAAWSALLAILWAKDVGLLAAMAIIYLPISVMILAGIVGSVVVPWRLWTTDRTFREIAEDPDSIEQRSESADAEDVILTGFDAASETTEPGDRVEAEKVQQDSV